MSNSPPAIGAESPPEEGTAAAAIGALLLIGGLVALILAPLGDPANSARWSVRDAQSLLATTRYSEAAALYEKILPLYGGPEVRLGLSYAYLARRDTGRAERQARAVIASAPLDLLPAAHAQLGRTLALAGDQAGALQAWSRAISSAEPFSRVPPVEAEARSALWHTAVVRWLHFDYAAARSALEQLANATQTDIYAVSARLKLAQLAAPDSNDISLKYLSQVEHDLHDPAASQGAAIPDLRLPGLREGILPADIESEAAGLRTALSDAAQARKQGARTGSIKALWGRAFLAESEPYLARTYLQEAVTAEPGLADARSYLALAQISTGDEQDAIPQLRSAIAADPQRPLPHYVLARLLITRKEWAGAQAELSALKRIEPNTVQFHLQVADYYAQLGAYDLAEDEYISSFDLEKASVPKAATGLDAALTVSRFYTDVRGMGCEKGLPAARESVGKHPSEPASLDAVGWALVQCNRPSDALSSLETAVQKAPDTARFRYHLGKAYALLNRTTGARTEFARAVDLDPTGPWEHASLAAIALLPP